MGPSSTALGSWSEPYGSDRPGSHVGSWSDPCNTVLDRCFFPTPALRSSLEGRVGYYHHLTNSSTSKVFSRAESLSCLEYSRFVSGRLCVVLENSLCDGGAVCCGRGRSLTPDRPPGH